MYRKSKEGCRRLQATHFVTGLATGMFIMSFLHTKRLPLFRPSLDFTTTVLVDSNTNESYAGEHLLEDLLFFYHSDKSKDDHKYSDLYQMIFGSIRHNIRNITEVGVNHGQSLQSWYYYFPNAHIYGFDINRLPILDEILKTIGDRVHFSTADLQKITTDEIASTTGLMKDSMDILIDDGSHHPDQQEDFLNNLWQLVKTGGFYIIEDVWISNSVGQRFWFRPNELRPSTLEIMTKEFDTVLVDTTIGHRNWDHWLKVSGPRWAKDRPLHNSYLLVMRRREMPLTRPVETFYGNLSMRENGVVLEKPSLA
jgi:hypothetical protein